MSAAQSCEALSVWIDQKFSSFFQHRNSAL